MATKHGNAAQRGERPEQYPNPDHDANCSYLITEVDGQPVIQQDELDLRNPDSPYPFRAHLPLNGIVNNKPSIAPELTYKLRNKRAIFTKHNGQMKLLFSEIAFLTRHATPGCTILYAGAAPGIHIKILFRMFPDLKWILVDPSKIVIRPSATVDVIQGLMTNALAEQYADIPNLLFISDIRTGSVENEEWDEEIEDNMLMQKSWCEILRPTRALLKFRLSWKREFTEYFAGTIYHQVWQPKTSTETRLDTDCLTVATYNNRCYDRRMMAHNAILRIQQYPTDDADAYSDCKNLCHCYDCTNSICTIQQWIASDWCDGQIHPGRMFALIIEQLGQNLDPDTAAETKSKTSRKHTSYHAVAFDKSLPKREKLVGRSCILGEGCDC